MEQNDTRIDHNKIMPHDECIGVDYDGCGTISIACDMLFIC